MPPVKSAVLFLSRLRQFDASSCKFFETWLARRWGSDAYCLPGVVLSLSARSVMYALLFYVLGRKGE